MREATKNLIKLSLILVDYLELSLLPFSCSTHTMIILSKSTWEPIYLDQTIPTAKKRRIIMFLISSFIIYISY